MKFGNINITKKLAREFFKITDSQPEDLAKWLRKNVKYDAPCFINRYMGIYVLVEDAFESSKVVRLPSCIFLPFDVWELHEHLQNKKNLKNFIKFLKEV